MKNILKLILLMFLLVFLSLIGGILFFKNRTEREIKNNVNTLTSYHESINKLRLNRISLLKDINDNLNCINEKINDTVFLNLKNDSVFFYNFLFYVENEKLISRNLKQESINEICIRKFNTLKKLDEELNSVSKKYNWQVKNFNLTYSTFPNFLLIKKMKVNRFPYIEFTFGEDNEQKVLEYKRHQHWIKTGEWLPKENLNN